MTSREPLPGDVSDVRKIDCYEVCTDSALLPRGAWVWVDWQDRTLRDGRVMLAQLKAGMRLVTVHQSGEGFVMMEANGNWVEAGDVEQFGACLEWRPGSRVL